MFTIFIQNSLNAIVFELHAIFLIMEGTEKSESSHYSLSYWDRHKNLKKVFADKNEVALMKKCEIICKRCQHIIIRNRKCELYCIVYVTIFNKLKNDHSLVEKKNCRCEIYFSKECMSYILWECSQRRDLKCKGTLTTDISVQNIISIRLKYKTLFKCSGLRCLSSIV